MDMDIEEQPTDPSLIGKPPKNVPPNDEVTGKTLGISEEELRTVEGYLLHKVLDILGM